MQDSCPEEAVWTRPSHSVLDVSPIRAARIQSPLVTVIKSVVDLMNSLLMQGASALTLLFITDRWEESKALHDEQQIVCFFSSDERLAVNLLFPLENLVHATLVWHRREHKVWYKSKKYKGIMPHLTRNYNRRM